MFGEGVGCSSAAAFEFGCDSYFIIDILPCFNGEGNASTAGPLYGYS